MVPTGIGMFFIPLACILCRHCDLGCMTDMVRTAFVAWGMQWKARPQADNRHLNDYTYKPEHRKICRAMWGTSKLWGHTRESTAIPQAMKPSLMSVAQHQNLQSQLNTQSDTLRNKYAVQYTLGREPPVPPVHGKNASDGMLQAFPM